MARSLRELSTKCGACGVVFDKDLNNKQPKRALCKECYIVELQRICKGQKDKRAEIGAAVNRIELYRDYKAENRQGFWREINKQIKALKTREEAKEFISNQMDRILGDDNLMHYINYISIADQRKNIKPYDNN
jgi:hypothetical protein